MKLPDNERLGRRDKGRKRKHKKPGKNKQITTCKQTKNEGET